MTASQVVVVTGASSGIGRATAVAFAARGDTVVLAARSGESLRDAERDCSAACQGATTLVVPTDVTDEAAVRDLARRAVERFGRIDVWVESAAVMAYGRFEDVPSEIYRRVVETILFGTVHAARAALPQFRRQGGGTLIVVGSLLGRITAPTMSAYVAGKWAVRGMCRALRQELRDTPGISVCLVSPAGVDTPIYLQAANYAGRAGRPPPPVDPPEGVARVIVGCADRPRREVLLGPTSRIYAFGFTLLPALYDVLVGPLLDLAGRSRRPVPPGPGNVLAPRPDGDRMHGRWGRRHRRPVPRR